MIAFSLASKYSTHQKKASMATPSDAPIDSQTGQIIEQDRQGEDRASEIFLWLLYFALVVISLLIQVFSVQTAAACNPQNKLLFGLLAILFPDIYLIQFAIRKYFLKTPGYCGNLPAPASAAASGSTSSAGKLTSNLSRSLSTSSQ